MSAKSVALSARISQQDAEFLAQLEVEGAKTPSDKLRSILTEARHQHEGKRDYASALRYAQQTLTGAQHTHHEAEHTLGIRSQLIERVHQWLPEMLALVLSHGSADIEPDPKEREAYEAELSSRLFTLMESILQLGMTDWSNCYAPSKVKQQANGVLLLSSILSKLNHSSTKK